MSILESSWIAVRPFERGPEGRVRFAHTAPWHVVIVGNPVRPRKEEVAFLIRRVRDEISRHRGVLPDAAMEEYREALRVCERIAERAR